MKTRFLLTLLALNSLLLGSTSVSAATTPDVTNLSRTISSLVDLGADSQSLMEAAINRALLAQKQTNTTSGQALINGGIGAPPASNTPEPPPLRPSVIIGIMPSQPTPTNPPILTPATPLPSPPPLRIGLLPTHSNPQS
jgi:hypothetical protein